jgi:site-specific DNA recombinase
MTGTPTLNPRSPRVGRVAGYLRVSRVGGRKGEGYISPEEQRYGILERAKSLDVEIHDDDWFFDEDRTGGNFNRPKWHELMAGLESGAFSGVICVRVDRFARNVAEGATMIERIDKTGAFFATSDLPMDTKTDEGRYVLNNFLNNAEFQLNLLKAGWWRAKKRAIARGAHIGPAPVGMGKIPKNAEVKAGCLYLLDDWRKPLTDIFEHAAAIPSDVAASAIARWANQHAPRPDGRLWRPQTIGYLLRNRVYIGEVAYRPRPDSEVQFEPLVNRNAHEALVDRKTFLAAQRTPRPRQDSRGSRAARVSLLQGLVRCQGCRHTMPPSRTMGNGRDIATYVCERSYSSGYCECSASITAERLEAWVLDQVKAQFRMNESFAPVANDRREEIADAERLVEEAETALTAIETNVQLGAAQPESWSTLVNAARAQHQAAVSALQDIVSSSKQQTAVAPAVLNWETVTAEELRDDIMPAHIDCIFVRKGRRGSPQPVHERAIILWRGQGPNDLPRKGRPAPAITPWPWPELVAA